MSFLFLCFFFQFLFCKSWRCICAAKAKQLDLATWFSILILQQKEQNYPIAAQTSPLSFLFFFPLQRIFRMRNLCALAWLGGLYSVYAMEVSRQCLQSAREYAFLFDPDTAGAYVAMQWASGHSPNDLGTFSNCDPGLERVLSAETLSATPVPYGWCTASYRVRNAGLPVLTGMCVPKLCTTQEMHNDTVFLLLVGDTQGLVTRAIYEPGSASVHCVSDQQSPWQVGSVQAVLVWLAVLLALTVAGTALHACNSTGQVSHRPTLRASSSSSGGDRGELLLPTATSYRAIGEEDSAVGRYTRMAQTVLLWWSAPRNVSRLLAHTPSKQNELDLAPLNGLRILAMTWVILGHALVFSLAIYDNLLYLFTIPTQRFAFQAVLQGTFSTDAFFFLSGFLGAYLLLNSLRTRNTLNWFGLVLARWLRLLPALLFFLLLYWQVAGYLPYGPLAYQIRENAPDQLCNKYWWTNLLFINNLWPGTLKEECMGWTWYLANDFQFSIILLPLVCTAYWAREKLGWTVLVLLFLSSFGSMVAIAQTNQLQVNVPSDDYMNLIYIKPWTRAPAYLVGPLLVFALDHGRDQLRLSDRLVGLVTVMALFLMATAVYSPLDLNRGNTWSQGSHTLYITFSRFIFCLGMGLVTWLLMTKQRGYVWLGQILGSLPCTPLARLAYGAYLVHETWMVVVYYSVHSSPQYSTVEYVRNYVFFCVLAYASSFVGYLLWEKPIMNLIAALLKQSSSKRVEAANPQGQAYTRSTSSLTATEPASDQFATSDQFVTVPMSDSPRSQTQTLLSSN
eukprot:g41336.t1